MRTPPPHRATTAHLQAAYPFVAEGGLGQRGVFIGRDLYGGSFCFDPWELYHAGALTSPNVVVLGQIGRGKSSFVKTWLWRALVFGRQAWVVDPKGEYGPLATACGSVPLRLVPGGQLRLNPLDLGASGADELDARPHRRAAELLCSVVAASLGRPLSPAERAATDLAVAGSRRRLGPVTTLPDVVSTLLDPDEAAAAEVGTDRAGLAADGRPVALELRRLVEGDLAGMFDAPTSASIDLRAPMVVLDLSALYRSPALGILMTCATAWLHAALGVGDGVKRLIVLDEAWATLHDRATARWLQAGFKLARASGAAHVAVVHRLSDLRAAGADGSAEQRLAEGLLADAETRVVYAQPPSEVAMAGDLLGLSSTERGLLPHLPRGVALWKVGERSFLIEHRLGRAERSIVDTDAAMEGP